MSGRRSSRADGSSAGTSTWERPRLLRGPIAKFAGTLPISTAIACSSWARWTPTPIELGAGRVDLGLGLDHIAAGGHADRVFVLGDQERMLVSFDGICSSRTFSSEIRSSMWSRPASPGGRVGNWPGPRRLPAPRPCWTRSAGGPSPRNPAASRLQRGRVPRGRTGQAGRFRAVRRAVGRTATARAAPDPRGRSAGRPHNWPPLGAASGWRRPLAAPGR